MWATSNLKKIPNIFNIWLGKNSDYWLILKLQEFLEKIWTYKWKQDWVYNNEVIDLIYDFQIKNQIIKVWELYWAWYWWNQTRNLFLKKYLNWDFDEDKQEENEVIELIEENIVEDNIEKDFKIFESFTRTYDKVIKLQELMQELSLYNWELTWIYKDVIDPIYDYQFSKWIVKWIYSPWAWNFWPKTRTSLKETYKKYLEVEEANLAEQERIDEENRLEQIRVKGK
jgi:hypothetical protein